MQDRSTSETLYRYIFDNINDAIFIHDFQGHFFDVNRVACERLGYSRDELVHMRVQQIDAPELAAKFDTSMATFPQRGNLIAETIHVAKDGTRIASEVSASLIEYQGQRAMLSVVRDIRERKRAEAEIHRLQEQIENMAIQAERERLGRELHDGLGQVLGFIGIKSAAISELLKQNRIAEAQHAIGELERVTQTAYADVREAILGLRSTVAPGVGLEPTLHEYLHRYQREWNIAVEMIVAPDASTHFVPTAEIQLLRIIQEALTNVRQHAHAQHVQVRVERAQDEICVTIVDDGCGFDPHQSRHEHFGLQTMRERADSFGGRLEIVSAPNQGTRVQVFLPPRSLE
jgi:PAS domain S-box-containing protein